MRCDGCRFWQRSTYAGPGDTRVLADYGECRHRSPRRNNADIGTRRPWARTEPHEWCGDYSEKPEARLDE